MAGALNNVRKGTGEGRPGGFGELCVDCCGWSAVCREREGRCWDKERPVWAGLYGTGDDLPDGTSGICLVPVPSHPDAKREVPGCDK